MLKSGEGCPPARGAPPLTIIFTLPPRRSFTLLNTSLSNSGVACTQPQCVCLEVQWQASVVLQAQGTL